jgi:3-hydroxyacyl-[acyl-carrier-protein] dehydratase
VLDAEELRQWTRVLKRGPLVAAGAGAAVAIGHEGLTRLLPHRSPMLLVDAIDVVDLDAGAVRGRRDLQPDDLGFAGHFPGAPIYPGVLVVEAMGQLALTLVHFTGARTTDVPADLVPRDVRATHIHHAAFAAPFSPGDTMTLHAQVVSQDYTVMAITQAWRDDTLAAYAISEVYVDE